jgi:hypothetical protein
MNHPFLKDRFHIGSSRGGVEPDDDFERLAVALVTESRPLAEAFIGVGDLIEEVRLRLGRQEIDADDLAYMSSLKYVSDALRRAMNICRAFNLKIEQIGRHPAVRNAKVEERVVSKHARRFEESIDELRKIAELIEAIGKDY